MITGQLACCNTLDVHDSHIGRTQRLHRMQTSTGHQIKSKTTFVYHTRRRRRSIDEGTREP